MDVLFATSNKHKVIEANEVGKKFGVKFRQIRCSYPEIRDDHVSNVAREGAKFVYAKVRKPVIVEDSGLFIKVLKNFPGTYSRYVFDSIGFDGILNLTRNKKDRTAFFISAVGFYNGKAIKVFEGAVHGRITNKAKGSSGFGFDPIFKPNGSGKTFAEDPPTKGRVSHRVKAFRIFCQWIVTNKQSRKKL